MGPLAPARRGLRLDGRAARGRHRRLAAEGRGLGGSHGARHRPRGDAPRPASVLPQGIDVRRAARARLAGGHPRRRGRVDLAGLLCPQARRVSRTTCGGNSRCTPTRPRFLRATVGAVGVLLVLGLARLLRHAPAKAPVPGPSELDHAAALVAEWPDVSASLALLGDKSLLFSESGRGMLMYGVAGRSWVALGDPVGPPAEQLELAWRFRELARAPRRRGPCSTRSAWRHLPLYIDLGLTLLKLGEEAMVPLAGFSLEGPGRRALRRTQRQMERDGVDVRGRAARACPAAPARAPGDFGCLAPRKAHAREGLLARVLRRGLPVAVSRGRGAPARCGDGLRQSLGLERPRRSSRST